MAGRSTVLFSSLRVWAAGPIAMVWLSSACLADDRPRWDVGEICASSSLGAQCPKIESVNRRSVLNRWEAMPVAVRSACTAQISSTGKPSYKALLTCLDESQMKALDQRPAAVPSKPNES